MKITIEPRHLTAGVRHNAYQCPVALALAEATGGPCSVGYSRYNVGRNTNQWRTYRMTQRAAKFVKQFDRGLRVSPCTLELGRRQMQ